MMFGLCFCVYFGNLRLAFQNEIKTHEIAAMMFGFLFLCLFWQFKVAKVMFSK